MPYYRYICTNGTVSNPDISYATQMSLPTVTQITKELIGQAVGLDITKNHVSMVISNLTGEIVKYVRIHKPYAPGEAYCCEINEELERFLNESGAWQWE